MKIERYYGEHEGGTKFYEILIATSGSKAVWARRWGAMGASGQTQISLIGAADGVREAAKLMNTKRNRGYRFGPSELAEIDNDAQLRNYLVKHHHQVISAIYYPLVELIKDVSPDLVLPDPPRMTGPEPARNQEWGSW